MATQRTRSSGRSTSRSSTRSGNRSGSSRSTRSSRTGTRSNGSRGAAARRSSATTSRSRSRSSNGGAVDKTREKVSQLASKAPGGSRVGNLASKAKGPLLAGGAALAGLAGGMALNRRNNSSKNPLRGMKAPSLPKSLKGIDLSKVDFDRLTDAAYRIRSIGEQVGEVADAAEKTRKKHR